MWLVLSEIESLVLCNTPTTPFYNELRTNLNCQFLVPINIGLSPNLGEHCNIVGGVIYCSLSEIQYLKLCNTPTTQFQNELRTKP